MDWMPAQNWLGVWMQAMERTALHGGAAIAGAWLIGRLLPGMSSGVRSWIWRVVYLKLILLLVWPSPVPLLAVPDLAVRIERTLDGADQSESPREAAEGTQHAPRSLPPADWMHSASPAPADSPLGGSWPGRLAGLILFVIWMSGVAWALVKTARDALATRRILLESLPLMDPGTARECAALCLGFRLHRLPELLTHPATASPQVAGWLRPRLLFPNGFLRQCSWNELRLVLAHELAHVKRHDLFWNWVRRFVNGILFFHPLVWLAHREATLAEEIASDETALHATSATVPEYAAVLMRVTEEALQRRTAAGLLGAGMSQAFHAMSRRLQALGYFRTLGSRIVRRQRWRATLLGCLATALLLPLGLLTWLRDDGIRQLDPRYQVLGFKVSRGQHHTLSVTREVCRFAGFSLSRVREVEKPAQDGGKPDGFSGGFHSSFTGSGIAPDNPSEKGFPQRVAQWLERIGLQPQLEVGSYFSNVFVSGDACAIIVRFAHDPSQKDYEQISALLVDERGETVPLIAHRSEYPPQSGEFVKFWVISPAPVLRSAFTLRLRLETEGKDVATIRLEEL